MASVARVIHQSRSAVKAAGALVAVLALGACGASQTTQTAQTADLAATQGAGSSAAGSAAAQAAAPSNSMTVDERLCQTENLDFALVNQQGAAGSTLFDVQMTNTGRAPCTMDGFAGVSLVTEANRSVIGAPAARETDIEHEMILIDPGQAASFTVKLTNASALDPAECSPTSAAGLRIYPPDETTDKFIPAPELTACGSDTKIMSVQPVFLTQTPVTQAPSPAPEES